MGASTDRKNRQDEIKAGTNKKMLAQQKIEEERKKTKRKWTIGGCLVAVLIALIILVNTNFFYSATTAVKIDGVRYSAGQVDYYLGSTYQSFLNNYGSYASYFGLDTSSSLKDQSCSMDEDGGTWYDYFLDQALETMKQTTAYAKYAEEQGLELDDSDEETLDSEIESLESAAESAGYSSTNKYLEATYGKGCTEKVIRKEMERSLLANKGYTQYNENLEFTDEEIANKLAENQDDYATYDFDYYFVAAETESTDDTASSEEEGSDADTATEEVTDETMAIAKEQADEILSKVNSGSSLSDAVTSVMGSEESASNSENLSGDSIASTYADWVKDSSRAAGDASVFESEDTGYYVVVYNSRDNQTYSTVNVRHILKQATADSNGNYTDEAMAEAKSAIDEVYATWQAGDKTEDSFAELANENSDDTGSNTNGGLYEDIYKNEMVESFNDWIFDSSRKAGDTTVIEETYDETGSYAGYHIIYFSSYGKPYNEVLAENDLQSEALEEFEDDLMGDVEPKTKFSIKFAGSAL